MEDERVCARREDAGGGERVRELLLLVSAIISICPHSGTPTPWRGDRGERWAQRHGGSFQFQNLWLKLKFSFTPAAPRKKVGTGCTANVVPHL